jgi:hypothetical protein
MYVKVMRRGRFGFGLHEVEPPLPQTQHVVVSEVEVDGEVIGVSVELCYNDLTKNFTVQLPRDGDIVYFENDKGDTVESLHWPPASKEDKRWQRTDSRQGSSTATRVAT